MQRHPFARNAFTAQVAGTLILTALTGCATTVGVPGAPNATDPACASVILAMPNQLGGLAKVRTTSQASTAWGSPGAAITARCGVNVPGPTTNTCLAVASSNTSIDWLVTQSADGAWTFTTYGRSPAVEVHVPPGATSTDGSTALIADLGPAVNLIDQTRRCLDTGDLSGPGTST